MEGGGFLSGIIQCQLASIHNQRQSCWDISENKTIHIPPPPLNSKLGCLLFSTGSLNSGTTLHGMMDGLGGGGGGGGRKLYFPLLKSVKCQKGPMSPTAGHQTVSQQHKPKQEWIKSQVRSTCSRTLLSSLGSAVGLFAHDVSLVLTVGWLAGGCAPQVGWPALRTCSTDKRSKQFFFNWFK